MSAERQQLILRALRDELTRQAGEESEMPPRISGAVTDRLVAVDGQIDLIALATAIDAALGGDTLEAGPSEADTKGPRGAGSSPKGAADQGLTPDELDASNDE
jgi:hypothetical protein